MKLSNKYGEGDLEKQLKELGAVGFEEGRGTTRPAYSPEYDAGRAYVRRLMEEAGLTVSQDAVGNLCGLLKGKKKTRLALGSHIDTVPGGGIYDGALGVLAAIACVRELRESGYENEHALEVIAFTEEEGNVIGGTFGSKCFAGQKIEEAELKKMKEHGIDEADLQHARRKAEDYLYYLEYHIEQGGVLEAEKTQIGAVEGIVAILRYKATVRGMANHAGTTPMALRNDALRKACSMIGDLMSRVEEGYEGMTCTVGDIRVPGGAANVIPGQCEFLIELRARSFAPMVEVMACFRDRYEASGLELEQFLEQKETVMEEEIISLTEEICREKGFSCKRMFSGAGHDAMNMAFLAPCGMLFIPSAGGISHNPGEYSSPGDIERGKEVLKELIVRLDRKVA